MRSEGRSLRGAVGLLASLSCMLAGPLASAADEVPPPEPSPAHDGSLITTRPLGSGMVGMSLGGGVAVLLPYYAIGAGVGVSDRVDIIGRFESVLGLLHYPHLGARWNFLDLGGIKLGAQLAVHYSFFGIKTDRVNLTSTFYSSGELAMTGAITRDSDLFFGLTSEVDFFEYDVVDDEGQVEESFRYDATIVRMGLLTKLTEDLDGYALARVRIPTETLTVDAQDFYIVPLLEIGGSWSF